MGALLMSIVVQQLHKSNPLHRALRRFRGASDGATAVEFALIAFPFFALVAAILEVSMTLWASETLDDALGEAARTIQTGQFQTENRATTDTTTLVENFRKQLCLANGQPRPTVFDCANVKVQVQVFSSMGASSAEDPIDPSTRDWSSSFGKKYSDPGASVIVVVQAATKFSLFFPNLLPVTPSFSDGSRLLQSVSVFRTEPYR